MFFFILITHLVDIVLILWWEIRSLSLLWVKGLNTSIFKDMKTVFRFKYPTPAGQGLNFPPPGHGRQPNAHGLPGGGGMLKFRVYQCIMNIVLSMKISFILYLLKIFVCLIHPSSSLTLVCHSIHPRSRYVCLDFFSPPKWSEGLQFNLVLLTLR